MSRPYLKLLGLLISLLLAYAWWIEPRRLTLTAQDILDPDKRLQTPVRVLLLTDWHLGRFSRPATLQAKMERIKRRHTFHPFDLILLGGDYVDSDPRYLELLTPCLNTLNSFGAPIYAVLGNHDTTSFLGIMEPVVACLERNGVKTLRNEAVIVTVRGQKLVIVGLNDLQDSIEYYDPQQYRTPDAYKDAAAKMDWYRQFDSFEPDLPRLLLSHNPDAVYLPGRRPLAVLSGHTHGGQMLPLDWLSRPLHRWIHPHLPPGSAVTWAGRRTVQGRTQIVSRGMEGSAIPVRFLRPPEAIVVTLR